MNSELENKVNYLYDSVKAEHISTKELYHDFPNLIYYNL